MTSGTCFACDLDDIYLSYHLLVALYPGWSLNEVKDMTSAERTWWVEMALWKKAMSQ